MKYPIWVKTTVTTITNGLLVKLFILISVLTVFAPGIAQASEHPLKKSSGGFTQELLSIAWGISPDPNWIMTLEAESGWRMDAVSPTGDYGLCQLNKSYHKKFIESEWFKDPKTQLLYCAQVYADASKRGKLKTTFYGYNVRSRTKDNFIWR